MGSLLDRTSHSRCEGSQSPPLFCQSLPWLSPGLSPWLRVCSEKTGPPRDRQQGQDTHDRDGPRPFGSRWLGAQHYPVGSRCHWAGCRDHAGQVQGWTPLGGQAGMSRLLAHTRGKGDHLGRVGASRSLSEPILPEKNCREEGHPPFCTTYGLSSL